MYSAQNAERASFRPAGDNIASRLTSSLGWLSHLLSVASGNNCDGAFIL